MAWGKEIVKKGDKGDLVMHVQKTLAGLGYDVGGIDGIYGAKTIAAVTEFQKKNGLATDGMVGPLTGAKLDEQVALHSKMPPPKAGMAPPAKPGMPPQGGMAPPPKTAPGKPGMAPAPAGVDPKLAAQQAIEAKKASEAKAAADAKAMAEKKAIADKAAADKKTQDAIKAAQLAMGIQPPKK